MSLPNQSFDIAVVMPMFNEEEGIVGWLQDLYGSFISIGIANPVFCVIDDQSTDSSFSLVTNLQQTGFPVRVSKTAVNMGHGPATYRALEAGLATKARIVLSIDGDGQFEPNEVAEFSQLGKLYNFQVAEGCRINREEPGYRKILSLSTRLLVFCRCHKFPIDANTPLRLYDPNYLASILCVIPRNSLVPNLHISSISRSLDVEIHSRNVHFLQRRGSPTGTMFGPSKQKLLPSKRLVKFGLAAIREWFVNNGSKI
jgi:glycosyltransferase involved in cell wall biosynthesis